MGEPQRPELALGQPLTAAQIISADSDQEHHYIGLAGQPAKLAIVERDSGALLASHGLPGGESPWVTLRASDGSVYLGTIPNGHLYQYRDGAVRDLGKAPGPTSALWTLAESAEGCIYGGGYPQGNLFQWDPATETFSDFGTVSPGQGYLRSLAISPDTGMIYAGVGTAQVDLVRINPQTLEKKSLLPAEFQRSGLPVALKATGGKIFLFINTLKVILVFDEATEEVEEVIPEEYVVAFSDVEPGGDHVYFTGDWVISRYNVATGEVEHTDHLFLADARELRWIDDEGQNLLSLTRGGGVIGTFSPSRDQLTTRTVTLPEEPARIRSLQRGPGGRIYAGGYLTGGLAVYDPATGTQTNYKEMSQPEGMTSLGEILYLGVYPWGRLYRYDTSRPWVVPNPLQDETEEKFNPRLLVRLQDYGQDRPFAMEASQARQEVYMGTVPDYGLLGGALTIYDVATEGYEVFLDLVRDQSIVTLAPASDGLVYGGTSIWGGLGSEPTQTEAQLFAFDPELGALDFSIVPVPGKKAITEIVEGPGGQIYGWAEGTLFVYDPAEGEVVDVRELVAANYTSSVFEDAKMELGADGMFYGTIRGQVFSLNPATLDYRRFAVGSNWRRLFTMDERGDFYFSDGMLELIRYRRW